MAGFASMVGGWSERVGLLTGLPRSSGRLVNGGRPPNFAVLKPFGACELVGLACSSICKRMVCCSTRRRRLGMPQCPATPDSVVCSPCQIGRLTAAIGSR